MRTPKVRERVNADFTQNIRRTLCRCLLVLRTTLKATINIPISWLWQLMLIYFSLQGFQMTEEARQSDPGIPVISHYSGAAFCTSVMSESHGAVSVIMDSAAVI